MIKDKIVLDYFLVPLTVIAACIFIFSNILIEESDLVDKMFNLFYIMGFSAFSFEVGFRKYFSMQREKYFFVIFLSPLIVMTFLYFYGLIKGYIL